MGVVKPLFSRRYRQQVGNWGLYSRLSLILLLFQGERIFQQTDPIRPYPGQNTCLGHCAWLAELWTHGGKIRLRGIYTHFIESTVKERCGKAVLLLDLECVGCSSSVILHLPRGSRGTLVFPLTTVIERTGALGSLGLGNQPGGPIVFPHGLEQVLGVLVTEMGVSPLYHFSFWQELENHLSFPWVHC